MSRTAGGAFAEEREKRILDLLNERGRITVGEVAAELGISASTVRLQLQKMHEEGRLLRTHGGAVKIDYPKIPQVSEASGMPEDRRSIVNREKKQHIAAIAAATVQDGDYIAISSGSTAHLMSKMLHGKRLTVVTDSVSVAHELMFDPDIRLYICGGEIRHRNGACFGPTAEYFLNTLKVDKSYSGVDSIDLDVGITSIDIDPRAEKALCQCGRKTYILADSTKFQVKPFIEKTMGLESISCIISDPELAPETVRRLTELGIQVITEMP